MSLVIICQLEKKYTLELVEILNNDLILRKTIRSSNKTITSREFEKRNRPVRFSKY